MKVVIDLDGTLAPFNTFKAWLLFSFLLGIFFFRVFDVGHLTKLAIRRAFGGMSRIEFKSQLIVYQSERKFWLMAGEVFGRCIKLGIRKSLLQEVLTKDLCLATAAPAIYVEPLARRMGVFSVIICSSVVGNTLVEAFSTMKRDLVSQKFSTTPDLLLTDHHDDLPLAQLCRSIVLVNPSKKSRQLFKEAFADSLKSRCRVWKNSL